MLYIILNSRKRGSVPWQVVRRLVDEGWHMLAMEELMSEYLVPVVRILDDCDDGGDVKKPGIELLKQVRDLVYKTLFHPPLIPLAC
jgi:hypothetical protein